MKKGIELSINFLVVLIISLVLFGLGVKFTYDIFSSAVDLGKMSQGDIHRQIEELQCKGDDRVCFGVETIEVERRDAGYFGVTVRNTLGSIDPVDFSLEVLPGHLYRTGEDPQDFTVVTQGGDGELQLNFEKKDSILNNDAYTFGIAVSPQSTAPSGTYSLNVKITCAPTGNDLQNADINKACESYDVGILRVKVV